MWPNLNKTFRPAPKWAFKKQLTNIVTKNLRKSDLSEKTNLTWHDQIYDEVRKTWERVKKFLSGFENLSLSIKFEIQFVYDRREKKIVTVSFFFQTISCFFKIARVQK